MHNRRFQFESSSDSGETSRKPYGKLHCVRRSSFSKVQFVFQFTQCFIANLTFVSQSNGSLPFNPKQFARDGLESTMKRGIRAVSIAITVVQSRQLVPVMTGDVLV